MLQNNSFNVDQAVNNFLAGADGGMDATANASASSSSSSSGGLTQRGGSSNSSNNNNNNNNNTTSNSNNSNSGSELVRQRNPFLDTILHPLRWLLKPRDNIIDTDSDTQNFIQKFNDRYGETHPTFHNRSYASAVRNAFQNNKYLLVYLHSPLHEDTDNFIKKTICKNNVSNICDNTCVTWMGSIEDVEGYSLSLQLQAHTYPFLALLVCKSDKEVLIADRIQGFIGDVPFLERLRNVQLAFSDQLTAIQLQQRSRAESISLREEQDRDFIESERQDRIRREERLQKEEQQRIDEAEKIRLAKEKKEIEEKAASDKTEILLKKRNNIRDEPPSASAGIDACTIRFQLPSGMKINRRFLKADTVQYLFDWLDVYFNDTASITTVNYSLSTAFPKVELTDLAATLDSYGLHPKAMLYVQDLDL